MRARTRASVGLGVVTRASYPTRHAGCGPLSCHLYSDGYPDTVEVYFRDLRVYRIEWNYWTE